MMTAIEVERLLKWHTEDAKKINDLIEQVKGMCTHKDEQGNYCFVEIKNPFYPQTFEDDAYWKCIGCGDSKKRILKKSVEDSVFSDS